MEKIEVGDQFRLKKKHPCGADVWEVVRVGADLKIKCVGCERIVMVPRIKFIKEIISKVEKS